MSPFDSESSHKARALRVKTPVKRPIDPRYDPLGYCPDDRRSQHAAKGRKAIGGSLVAMIDLACIHCMGFQPNLVSDCTDPKCPLWIRATRKKA